MMWVGFMMDAHTSHTPHGIVLPCGYSGNDGYHSHVCGDGVHHRCGVVFHDPMDWILDVIILDVMISTCRDVSIWMMMVDVDIHDDGDESHDIQHGYDVMDVISSPQLHHPCGGVFNHVGLHVDR